METLVEGYLSEEQQSVSKELNYCHSLLTSHHVPSAGLLYHLTNRLMSDHMVSLLLNQARVAGAHLVS